MKNLVGATLAGHEILEQLGGGGMANVYKAYHPGLAVHRAIKVIRPDLADADGFRERFQREARAVAALRHPNIVQIHDFGQQDDLYFMIMEFVEGEDLKAKIMREGAIRPFSETVRITEQIATALGYAHQRGVVHRDVKPDNVLLDRDGQAILADFGIAKMIEEARDSRLTATGTGLGTPSYMAPEQAMGSTNVGAPADLYAVGVVLYEMLTAHLPFSADTPLAVLQKVIYDPVPPPREFSADIPDALQGVVLKAMAKDPNQRYPNAAALVEAARQSLAGLPAAGSARVPQVAVPPPPPPAEQPVGVTDGGTVVYAKSDPAQKLPKVDTRPAPELAAVVPGAPVSRGSKGSGSKGSGSKGPLLLFAALVALAFLLVVGTVAGGYWWFARDKGDSKDSLTAFSNTVGGGLGLTGNGGSASAGTEGHSEVLPVEVAGGGEAGSGSGGSSANASEASTPGTVSGSPASSGSTSRASANTPSGQAPSGTKGKNAAAEPAVEDSWRNRSSSAQGRSPVVAATVPAAPAGPIFRGRVRFGRAFEGEVEPEEPVTYELEIKRPTTFYFDIRTASQLATYTLRSPDGQQVFSERGSDVGPVQLDRPGLYVLTVETDGGVPVQFEVEFIQVGS